ncbi:MAG: aminopeptidase N [Lysobacteraceae bacterium]|nr:MAG: aminopeptidase N [Xanthomonadaceae bacterium]
MISTATLILTVVLGAGGAEEFQRLGEAVAPSSQTIYIKADPYRDDFSGRTTINLDVEQVTNQIRFHARDLEIDNYHLTAGGGKSIDELTITRGDAGLVVLTAPQPLSTGQYHLDIAFRGQYNRNSVGLYKIDVGEDAYLSTQFEMQDARRAFPVWDEPSFKIPFQLTLAVPAGLTAISNTPVLDMTTVDNWTEWRFDQTKSIPSYLVAMAVGPWERVEIPDSPVPSSIYTPRGQSQRTVLAVETIPVVHRAMEAYFGQPYPYQKLDHVAVPEFPYGAMENVGMITYRSEILLLDPSTASIQARTTQASVVAHEIGHQWYGNLVTMAWWDDLWLNEAFATWIADKITVQQFPQFRSHLSLPQSYAMPADARPSTLPIRKPVQSEADIMDGLGLAYAKGITVLRMVEDWVGADVFRQGVLNYLQAHEFGNAKAADLWGALSEASGKDVKSVLSSYLDQPGLPLIEAKFEGTRVDLAQRRFLNFGAEAADLQWSIPLTLRYGSNGAIHRQQVVLSEKQSTFETDHPVDWLYPDADANGYFRWQLSPQAFDSLIENLDALTARERIALLSNIGALVDAGSIGAHQYLSALQAFAHDQVPEVISEVISGLLKVRDEMLPTENTAEFAPFVRNTLSPAVERFGIDARPGEAEAVSKLRPGLLLLLGRDGRSGEVIATAQQRAERIVDDAPDIDPATAGSLLRVAAQNGDALLYERFKAAYLASQSPRRKLDYLRALGSFKAEALRIDALAFSLTEAVRAPDMRVISSEIARTDAAGQGLVFDWFLQRYEVIAAKLPPFRHGSIPSYLPIGCDMALMDKADAFFTQQRIVDGTLRSLEKARDKAQTCANLKTRVAADIKRFLKGVEAVAKLQPLAIQGCIAISMGFKPLKCKVSENHAFRKSCVASPGRTIATPSV